MGAGGGLLGSAGARVTGCAAISEPEYPAGGAETATTSQPGQRATARRANGCHDDSGVDAGFFQEKRDARSSEDSRAHSSTGVWSPTPPRWQRCWMG